MAVAIDDLLLGFDSNSCRVASYFEYLLSNMSKTGGDIAIRTDSQGTTTLIVAIFFGALTAVVIAVRLFARVIILRHVGLDDGRSAIPSQ